MNPVKKAAFQSLTLHPRRGAAGISVRGKEFRIRLGKAERGRIFYQNPPKSRPSKLLKNLSGIVAEQVSDDLEEEGDGLVSDPFVEALSREGKKISAVQGHRQLIEGSLA